MTFKERKTAQVKQSEDVLAAGAAPPAAAAAAPPAAAVAATAPPAGTEANLERPDKKKKSKTLVMFHCHVKCLNICKHFFLTCIHDFIDVLPIKLTDDLHINDKWEMN